MKRNMINYKNTLHKKKIQLLYQDRDAFVIQNKTNLVNDLGNFQENYEKFDFSNLDKNNQLFSKQFKQVPGYLNLETP